MLLKLFTEKKKKWRMTNSHLFDEKYYLENNNDVTRYNGEPLEHYIKYGEAEGRKPNPFFDPKWYVSNNKGSMGDITSPLLHYILKGEDEGLCPSPIFDPQWYLNTYQDVKKSSHKPLQHYLVYGVLEKRLPNRYFNPSLNRNSLIPAEYYSEKNQKLYNDDVSNNPQSHLKIAVTVHVYYLEMVPEILDYLSNIPYQYSFFFTVSTESREALVKILKSNNVADYKLIIYPNQGYDLAPFLHLLTVLKKDNYELVCKIHTKKGPPHLEIYSHWFDCLMDPILGSKRTVANIIKAFEENEMLGVVGTADFYKSVQKLMYGNETPVAEILSTLDKELDPLQEWGFFAGTIFWARLDFFEPLMTNTAFDELIEKNIKIEMESGAPVSIFHALERVLGALPILTGMSTGVSHRIYAEESSYAVQLLEDDFNTPSSVGIHATLVDIVPRMI